MRHAPPCRFARRSRVPEAEIDARLKRLAETLAAETLSAAPVGALAFPALTLLHRPLARGGMIDAARFRPLAWGVTLSVAAFILGL